MSSGSKPVTDDPAGVGIGDRLKSQVEAIDAELSNIQNNISSLQTKDAYFSEATKALATMESLSVKAQSGTATESDIANMEEEFSSMQDGLMKLSTDSLKIDNDTVIGTVDTYTYDENNNLVGSLHTEVTWGEVIDSQNGINVDSEIASAAVMKAIDYVSDLRVDNIAEMATEQSSYSSLLANESNLISAESSYTDVDEAWEAETAAKYAVLTESGVAMLSQANRLSSMPLSLIGG